METLLKHCQKTKLDINNLKLYSGRIYLWKYLDIQGWEKLAKHPICGLIINCTEN